MGASTISGTRAPFTFSLRLVGWSLAIVCVATVSLIALVVLREACDPSGDPHVLLAGRYQGDWQLTDESRALHPELAAAHERLRMRVVQPIRALDAEGYRTHMPERPFDVARTIVAWNEIEAPCLLRVEDPWQLPRVIYQPTSERLGNIGYGSYFSIAMDSSLSPACERLYVTLGDGMGLAYRRAEVAWYWRAID